MYTYKELYTLDFRGVKDSMDVHRIIKKELDFPDYYGCNWDALWDCLTEIYEEAKELLDYVNSLETKDKLERIVEKLVAYGTYETIPLSVKADILAFDLADASGNLKLFMSVLKQLGVKMEQDEMFEEYQKIYTETVERAGREERSEVWRGKER